jgi:4-hydroxy-3-methylbut-2-enyl diphosphate reductase
MVQVYGRSADSLLQRGCSGGAPQARRSEGAIFKVPVEKVLLAEPRGFCAGVEMAIKALAWMVRAFEPPVYCYHEIVHNRLVVDRFREKGVIFVDDVADVPPGAPLMLSAHGSAPEVVAAARANGRYVVDAVCPLVTKVHHEAKVRARKGFTILYVGHAGHDEAVGTLAVAPGAMRLVERAGDLAAVAAEVGDPERVAVLAQTTLAQNEWAGIVDEARERFPSVWTATRNDLCFATTNRQRALTEIARRADAVVVIGSANSSNTIALAKVAREAGCAAVLRIDGPGELDLADIGDARVVGVTAGASAPEELVDAVIAKVAPIAGVERVRVTEEDEYFPPPRELRELLPALDAAAALALGGDPELARSLGGPFSDDRVLDASRVLASLGD